jgi:hypothetical protein
MLCHPCWVLPPLRLWRVALAQQQAPPHDGAMRVTR